MQTLIHSCISYIAICPMMVKDVLCNESRLNVIYPSIDGCKQCYVDVVHCERCMFL